jgi:hypothetical protein
MSYVAGGTCICMGNGIKGYKMLNTKLEQKSLHGLEEYVRIKFFWMRVGTRDGLL